jgi:hypothetical protein
MTPAISEVDLLNAGSFKGIPSFNQGSGGRQNEVENRVVELEFSE